MKQLNSEKVAKLHNTNELLDRKYGKRGTPARVALEERAQAHYGAERKFKLSNTAATFRKVAAVFA